MRARGRLANATGIILVASLLTACVPPGSVEQTKFVETGAAYPDPTGFVIASEPTRVCETLTPECDEATVITAWVPADDAETAADVCTGYLAWAAELGIGSIFSAPGGIWIDWFEPDEHSLIITGAIATIPIGTPDAAELCTTIVQRLIDLPPDASRAAAYEIIGIGGVPGVAGGLTVTRILPPRTVPDGRPDREAGRLMIVAVTVLI
jgi:hypothetical protein